MDLWATISATTATASSSPVIHTETSPLLALQTQSPPLFSQDCAPTTLVVVPPVNADGSLHYFYCLPPELPFLIYPFQPVSIGARTEQPGSQELQSTKQPHLDTETAETIAKTSKTSHVLPKRPKAASGIKKKKAINPYIAFSIEMRKKRLQTDPFIGNRQLILEIGQMWSKLSLSEREEYAVLAKKLTDELN